MEAELGQAADQDEHYNGQVVLHQAPLPPNQAEQEYVDISFVNVSVSYYVLAFPSKLIIQLTGSDRNGCENHYQVSVLLDCKISHGLAIKPLQIYQASSYFRLVSSIHH